MADQTASEGLQAQRQVRRTIFPVHDRSFQVRTTLAVVLLILVSHLFLLAIHYRSMTRTATMTHGQPVSMVEMQVDQQRRVWTRDLVLGVLAISVAVSVVVFWLTQRVSGPIYVVDRVLEQFKQGRHTERVRLRKNDELQWFATRVNEFLDHVETQRK